MEPVTTNQVQAKEKHDDGLAIALMRLYRDMRFRLSRATPPEDEHTALGTAVLYQIQILGNPRLKELAIALHVAPPTLTPVMAKLVEEGYVLRAKDAGDARAARFTMTMSGIKSYQRGVAAMVDAMDEMVKKLDGAKRASLYDLINEIQ